MNPIPSIQALDAYAGHRTGLAPHYLTLWSLAIGLGAKRVFEFGRGESTTVLLDALRHTQGHLISISTDGFSSSDNHWCHLVGKSEELLPTITELGPFDLVLHDGSHAASILSSDLRWAIPQIKNGGLVLIHDTMHSYSGKEMRLGLAEALGCIHSADPSIVMSWMTLPFAFGLMVIQVFNGKHLPVTPTCMDKPSSPHHSELFWIDLAS